MLLARALRRWPTWRLLRPRRDTAPDLLRRSVATRLRPSWAPTRLLRGADQVHTAQCLRSRGRRNVLRVLRSSRLVCTTTSAPTSRPTGILRQERHQRRQVVSIRPQPLARHLLTSVGLLLRALCCVCIAGPLALQSVALRHVHRVRPLPNKELPLVAHVSKVERKAVWRSSGRHSRDLQAC